MTFLRNFLYIVAAAFVSAALGGLFAALVSFTSPEFVKGLFSPPTDAPLTRYAIAVGMIRGLFLGTGVMGFSLLLVTCVQIAHLMRKRSEQAAEPGRTP